MKRSSYRLLLGTIWALSLTAVLYLVYRGNSYYVTPLIERPRHADYWVLKPAGTRGHLFGVTGLSLLIVMHLYSVRRRIRALRQLGKLRAWLDFHILCGVIGPLLVALHSSFKVQGLIALSFWAMWAVVFSGMVGRFLYGQIPRRASGEKLTLAEVEQLNRRITKRLRDEFGLSEGELMQLQAIGRRGLARDVELVPLLARLPVEAVALRWRVRRFASGLHPPGPRLIRERARVARQKAWIECRLLLLQKLQRLFHYWHVFHKPFAIIMYALVIVHVAVAIATGYGWPRH